jgi:hypothetical protein
VPTVETELRTLPGVGAALGKLLSIVNVTARCDAASTTTNSISNNGSSSSSNGGNSNPYSKGTAAVADTADVNSKDNSSSNNKNSSSCSSSIKQPDGSTVDDTNTSGSAMAPAAADVVDISRDLYEDVCKDVCATADTDNNALDNVDVGNSIRKVVQPVEQYVDSDCIAASSSGGECYSATQTDATQIDTTQTQCIEDD